MDFGYHRCTVSPHLELLSGEVRPTSSRSAAGVARAGRGSPWTLRSGESRQPAAPLPPGAPFRALAAALHVGAATGAVAEPCRPKLPPYFKNENKQNPPNSGIFYMHLAN